MGFALPLMAVASVVGAGLSAYGQYNQMEANSATANYQAQVARNNALVANQNAAWAGQAGEAKEAAQGMKNAARIGQEKAALGAGGIDVNTGSAANTITSSKELGMTDVGTIASNSAREVYGYEVASTGDIAQANLLETEAQNYASAAPVDALGTFLSGASSGGSKYASWLSGLSNPNNTPTV